MKIIGAILLLVGAIFLIFLSRLRQLVRNIKMKKLANEFGLHYESKQNLWSFNWVSYDKNYITGTVGKYSIVIHDVVLANKYGLMKRETKVLLDGAEQDLFTNMNNVDQVFSKGGMNTPTHQLRKYLEEVKNS
jgi:hypothetical protein